MSETDPFFAPYDEVFWRENGSKVHREAERKIGRVLYDLTRPKHVIDVGCGTGQMLRAIDEAGGRPVMGIESPAGVEWCRRLGIQDLEADEVVSFDLRTGPPFPSVNGRPGLVVCVEVAEHLPEEDAKRMVQWICRTLDPDWIAFSGAAPGTPGGTGHINEQHPLYWMNLVHSFNTHWYDALASDELHRRTIGTFTWSPLVNLYRRLE